MKFKSYKLEPSSNPDSKLLWKGFDEQTETPIRLRKIPLSHCDADDYRERVRQVAGLSDIGIVPVLDAGWIEDENHFYIVSHRVEGEVALSSVLDRLDWREFSKLLGRALELVGHGHAHDLFHTGIDADRLTVHRLDGSERRLRVHEFGMLSSDLKIDGRAAFQSPEVRYGRPSEIGAWSDVYSLGVLTEQWLERQSAEDGPAGVIEQLDLEGEIRDWIALSTNADPADRFELAADARAALESIEGGGSGACRRSVSMPVDPRAAEPDDSHVSEMWWRYSNLYRFRTPPMTGREDIRQQLWGALHSVHATGKARGVVIDGARGLGGGRLATWLERRALEQGLAGVLRATHSSMPGPADGPAAMFGRHFGCSSNPLSACRAGIVNYFDVRGMDVDDEAIDQWSGWLTADDDIDVEVPDDDVVGIDMLKHLCRRRPLILRVGDGHWASATLDWCEAVLSTPLDLPVLVVVEVHREALVDRPIERVQLDQLSERDDVEQLRIEPMNKPSMLELIDRLAPLEQRLSHEIARRAAGNPLFAVQLLRDWIEREELMWSDNESGRLALSDERDVQLPAGLTELGERSVEHFVSQFGPRRRQRALRALEVAAVLGTEVVFDEWERVCHRLEIQIPRLLVRGLFAHGAADELARADGFVFNQSSFREALLRQCRQQQRIQRVHRVCGAVIDEQQADAPAQAIAPERVGIHRFEAGDFEEALEPLLIGSRRRGNHDDIRQVLVLQSRYTKACDQLDLETSDPRRLRGVLREAWALHALGDREAARRKVNYVEEHLRAEDEAELLGPILWLKGGLAFRGGDMSAVKVHLERAREHHQTHGDRRGLARTELRRGSRQREIGELDDSIQTYRRACELFDELDDEMGRAEALRGEASVLMRKGDTEAAEAILLGLVNSDVDLGAVPMSRLHNNLGEVYRRQQRWENATAAYGASIEITERHRPSLTPTARLNLAMALVEQQRYGEAADVLGRVEEYLEERAANRQTVYLALASMPCAAARGDWDEWCARATVVEEYVRAHGVQAPDMESMFQTSLELARQSAPEQIVEWARDLVATQRDDDGSGEA